MKHRNLRKFSKAATESINELTQEQNPLQMFRRSPLFDLREDKASERAGRNHQIGLDSQDDRSSTLPIT